ncbi:MAG: hypothetical protein E6H54_05405 [Betaproteobacteria bacterium]|nr:MAG: hypothetical protein E6H54_05405 [Betaproteobacteria bacterium]
MLGLQGRRPGFETIARPHAGDCMKHILDSDFRYRPSFDTDVKKTFERIRRQQQLAKEQQVKDRESKAQPEVQVKVLKLDQLKKASNTV